MSVVVNSKSDECYAQNNTRSRARGVQYCSFYAPWSHFDVHRQIWQHNL